MQPPVPDSTATKLLPHAGIAGHSWVTVATLSIVVAVLLAFSIPRRNGAGPEPLPRLEYDIHEIGQYWAQRPVAVASRSAVVALEGLRWGVGRIVLPVYLLIRP